MPTVVLPPAFCAGGPGDREHELRQLPAYLRVFTPCGRVGDCLYGDCRRGLDSCGLTPTGAGFMGDVGSLALGGALSIIAVLLRQEFPAGDRWRRVFVAETLSSSCRWFLNHATAYFPYGAYPSPL